MVTLRVELRGATALQAALGSGLDYREIDEVRTRYLLVGNQTPFHYGLNPMCVSLRNTTDSAYTLSHPYLESGVIPVSPISHIQLCCSGCWFSYLDSNQDYQIQSLGCSPFTPKEITYLIFYYAKIFSLTPYKHHTYNLLNIHACNFHVLLA